MKEYYYLISNSLLYKDESMQFIQKDKKINKYKKIYYSSNLDERVYCLFFLQEIGANEKYIEKYIIHFFIDFDKINYIKIFEKLESLPDIMYNLYCNEYIKLYPNTFINENLTFELVSNSHSKYITPNYFINYISKFTNNMHFFFKLIDNFIDLFIKYENNIMIKYFIKNYNVEYNYRLKMIEMCIKYNSVKILMNIIKLSPEKSDNNFIFEILMKIIKTDNVSLYEKIFNISKKNLEHSDISKLLYESFFNKSVCIFDFLYNYEFDNFNIIDIKTFINLSITNDNIKILEYILEKIKLSNKKYNKILLLSFKYRVINITLYLLSLDYELDQNYINVYFDLNCMYGTVDIAKKLLSYNISVTKKNYKNCIKNDKTELFKYLIENFKQDFMLKDLLKLSYKLGNIEICKILSNLNIKIKICPILLENYIFKKNHKMINISIIIDKNYHGNTDIYDYIIYKNFNIDKKILLILSRRGSF